MKQFPSTLQGMRQQYRPSLPRVLQDLLAVHLSPVSVASQNPDVQAHFPSTSGLPFLTADRSTTKPGKVVRVGVVFSGGQAAGGHTVVCGLFDALRGVHPDSTLVGFLGGPSGIVRCETQELDERILLPYRNQGGFDLLGSGRTKIETEEQFAASLNTMNQLKLDGLVIVGGDDSNTNAALLAEYFAVKGCATKVVGVPKTIDGDLKNERVAISFGFDTACKTYSETIGNIARDALSARKYYHFIRLMGRSASHIALECALATQPTYTVIGEEVFALNKTLKQVVGDIADLVGKRADAGKEFGVILIPEGLIEFIPEINVLIQELNQILVEVGAVDHRSVTQKLSTSSKECFNGLPELIQRQLLLSRDPHGNVQVSFIETEKLLMAMVADELIKRSKEGRYKGKFNPISHFLGYEGRSGFPSNFDCNYCYSLGFTAALLICSGHSGYMCFVDRLEHPVIDWEVGGVPLSSLMHVEIRKGMPKPVIKKALVDLRGKAFQRFAEQRERWTRDDLFRFPGPIQFFGPSELIDSHPFSL
jgi:pyrophosphate--fructose-6-phosphate 1-phosphotransferase